MKTARIIKTIIKFALVLLLLLIIASIICNLIMYIKVNVRIYKTDKLNFEGADCILVLGAGVREDGQPSNMLEDRLKTAVELYNNGLAPKILMSGDHGRKEYDEVGCMKAYALNCGVNEDDIFLDHAGFSTYESLYRAKEIFGAEKIIIVTQEYHLYRALYIADSFELEAVGVSADLRTYIGQSLRETREIAARVKDFIYTLFKPEPTYLGEKISLTGSGRVTEA